MIVYGTELNIYNKREKCLLKSGSYDLVLQELGSKFHTKKDGVWETAGGGKVSSACRKKSLIFRPEEELRCVFDDN